MTAPACATPACGDLVRPLPGTGQHHVSLAAAEAAGAGPLLRLPRSLKVLAEDILWRQPLAEAVAETRALCARDPAVPLGFTPRRALLQDFMGIPLMTDLATLRDALAADGMDPRRLDPAIPVDFVVDHAMAVMVAGRADALAENRRREFEANRERFAFIKWCQQAFARFRVIPPGRGIMHQVNLEWLATVVQPGEGPVPVARADTMIGTDSHTTMVNALGVLGWGVGGIEAETAMLGLPLDLVAPRVVGVALDGSLPRGATATDLVLHLTAFLRGIGVVGAFVEMTGPGLDALPLADRATIANMAPEYGATCTFFPVDGRTLDYLRITGRSPAHLRLVETHARAQGLWREPGEDDTLAFDALHRFDLGTVEPSMAGPARPQDRRPLSAVPAAFARRLADLAGAEAAPPAEGFGHGAVAIAAITSCTNTANPAVMMAAGLLARNAVARGLKPKPWVKTSLTPGSRVVTDYLDAAGLTPALDALGFQTAGYGCATCNGNSGPLAPEIAARIEAEGLVVSAVLSGNRNFEGRIHPQVKAAWLASPPLVIAAALAGTVTADLATAPLGHDPQGRPVTLADLWPDPDEVAALVARHVTADRFAARQADMETTPDWAALDAPSGPLFAWDPASTFIAPSPFPALGPAVAAGQTVQGARVLALLGDGITTDHIAPNGAIRPDSDAGRWLTAAGVPPARLGNYGARRGHAAVCARGMFDNPLLENGLLPATRGNLTVHHPTGERVSLFEAGRRYAAAGIPAVIVAGRDYGAGSSRDWAAKGLRMMGVVAVLAQGFERIHRSNLVGMGVLPLVLPDSAAALGIDGATVLDLALPPAFAPGAAVAVTLHRPGSAPRRIEAALAVATTAEAALLDRGGVLPSILARARG